MTITDEYMNYYIQYTKEYGENTCILMQIGSFYEMHMVKNDDETIGNIFKVCDILNIQVTRRNKSIEKIDRNNPYMAGFPIHSFSKYLPILLEHHFTVVVIEQNESDCKNRFVSAIYSPSIPPLDHDRNIEESALMCILLESESEICVGYLNVTTNRFEVFEFGGSHSMEELEKYILSNPSNEYLVYCSYELSKDSFVERFDIDITNIHYYTTKLKEQRKIDYQNTLFRKVYSDISFGILNPIEYFDLERHQMACLVVILILEFVSNHNKAHLLNLQRPIYSDTSQFLNLEMNTLQQLSVLPHKQHKHKWNSLFNVIDFTKTFVGRRALKRLLCSPLKNIKDIEEKYNWNDFISTHQEVDKYLSDICDIERLHRKMGVGILNINELYNLKTTYDRIIQLHSYLYSNTDIRSPIEYEISRLYKYIEGYEKYIDSTKLSSMCFFKPGLFPTLDEMECTINKQYTDIENMRCFYENMIKKQTDKGDWIKLSYTEQEGHYFTCTKIRAQYLQRELEKIQSKSVHFKSQTSCSKFTNEVLQNISHTLRYYQDKFQTEVQKIYRELIKSWFNEYKDIFQSIQRFIETIDIAYSNTKCKTKYSYCRPIIKDSSSSFLNAKQLRHPIIERIHTDIPYIPNDIHLSDEANGMVLYALNSGGKSSLLRSIGLCVLMAQCGMYVPCSEMSYYPFDTIITQVDMVDNLWKSQSSFVSEMIGLRRILKVSNSNCLVLSDELTKGTEVISATSIFTATILELASKKSKFVFTTHLQNVSSFEEIRTHPRIRISHLSVNIINETIYFERLLKDGPSSELYGLEVARAVGLGDAFMNKSFEIRERLLNATSSIQFKRSRYNRTKILDCCEICNYKPIRTSDIPLDTHHIKFQCEANQFDIVEYYHKNTKCNLVCLCKSCHIAVHKHQLTIHGYISTSKGVQLQYTKEDTNTCSR